MTNYHINLDGEPGLCRARSHCPFGDLFSEHYQSKEAARAAYETQQQGSFPRTGTDVPLLFATAMLPETETEQVVGLAFRYLPMRNAVLQLLKLAASHLPAYSNDALGDTSAARQLRAISRQRSRALRNGNSISWEEFDLQATHLARTILLQRHGIDFAQADALEGDGGWTTTEDSAVSHFLARWHAVGAFSDSPPLEPKWEALYKDFMTKQAAVNDMPVEDYRVHAENFVRMENLGPAPTDDRNRYLEVMYWHMRRTGQFHR